MTSGAPALLASLVLIGGAAALVTGGVLEDPGRAIAVLSAFRSPDPGRMPAQAAPAPPASTPSEASPPGAPRFDVVRIGGRGTAVIAGRAAPEAEVVLLDDGEEVARARADQRGEWVILPAEPLRPGTRQFSLLSRLGGEERAGQDSVVVIVPELSGAGAGPGVASGSGGGARRAEAATPLVLLVPPTQAPPRLLQGPAPAPQQALALGQVDYDEAGFIRFAGSAAPNATVRVYVDDRHAGDAQADPQGRWVLAPQDAVPVGRHRLRLDQLAHAGAVAARVELPFQRDELPEGAVPGGRVVVQPGHNLWRLARSSYGSGTRFTVIFEANREQIGNPNLIFPGQVFALPVASPADSSRSR